MTKQMTRCRSAVAAGADRRPSTAWGVVSLGVGLGVAVPGLVVGWTATYLLAPAPFYWFLVLPLALLMAGLAVTVGYATTDLPGRWFGWSRRRAAVTGLLLGLAGLAPWAVPDGPSLGRAGQAPGWAAAFYGTGLLAVPAAALLLVPRRRVRAAAAVGLLLVAGLWGCARSSWLDAESRASYRALGSPPHPLLRLVDWGGNIPTFLDYRNGRVSIEYDEPTPLPVPDGSRVAVLVTESLPPGSTADPLCAEGPTVAYEALTAAGAHPDTSTACQPVGPGLVQVGSATLARQDGDALLFLVLTDDAITAENLLPMVRALDSEHPATDAELRYLAHG